MFRTNIITERKKNDWMMELGMAEIIKRGFSRVKIQVRIAHWATVYFRIFL